MKEKNKPSLLRAHGRNALHVPYLVRTGIILFCFVQAFLLNCGPAAGEQAEAANAVPPAAVRLNADAVRWQNRAPGFDVLELNIRRHYEEDAPVIEVSAAKEAEKSDMVIVRSDPNRFEYTLLMASEDGQHLSLAERARQHDLLAAINAGMYLPDNLKNTGYMRNGEHINNPRIVANFGSFFVAGPRKSGLPEADLLEKSELGATPKARLDEYGLVIQNYRLIGLNRKILWPDTLSAYSISALGKDRNGNILFIACEYPLSAPDFSRVLMSLPLGNMLAMYLEGGSQAGMALAQEEDGRKTFRIWRGRHGGLAGLGRPDNVPLPNVLGIRPKN